MEIRNFHTSMLGGFRKKDVIAFLAEEKLRHEQELQDLQRQLEEASAQVRDLMEQRDEAQANCQNLLQQLEEARQARDAQAAAFDVERAAHTEAEIALRLQVQELENRPAPEPVLQVNSAELETLREALAAERERVQALDACLRQQPERPDSQEHLWALCSKMERTLRQMERMLDGPLRMTCYPEPIEAREPEEEPIFEMPAAPAAASASADPRERSSVSSLLKKIRRRD